MAKLNGVKVTDMVGGEVTKITYDGEEYAKVVSESDYGNKGDIALVVRGWGDQSVGEYYRVINEDHEYYGLMSDYPGVFIDGKICDSSCELKYVEIFRKAAEQSTETISEQVASHEQRITALEQAEEKPKLEVGEFAKVVGGTNHMFAEGDLVERVDNGTDFTTLTRFRRLSDGLTQYVKNSDIIRATDAEFAKAKAKAERKQGEACWAEIGRKPDEYKERDIVRVIGDNVRDSVNKDGDIGEITEIDAYEDDPLPYQVRVKSRKHYGRYGWHSADSIELITPAERRLDV